MKYNITYNLNGGTNHAKNPATDNEGGKAITLEAPTKESYTFAGWYKNSKLTKKSASIPEGSTGDKTFYAKWTANKYTVKFNKNGGKGKMGALKNKGCMARSSSCPPISSKGRATSLQAGTRKPMAQEHSTRTRRV